MGKPIFIVCSLFASILIYWIYLCASCRGTFVAKSISYEHLEYTLHKLLISYSDLEKRYDFDLTGVRYSVIIYFFHRYIVYIANRNYTEIRKELEKSCANPLIKGVFYDKKYLLKGKKMKLILIG